MSIELGVFLLFTTFLLGLIKVLGAIEQVDRNLKKKIWITRVMDVKDVAEEYRPEEYLTLKDFMGGN